MGAKDRTRCNATLNVAVSGSAVWLYILVTSVAYSASPGSLDTSFGLAGLVKTGAETEWDVYHAVALQSDGKILVGGVSASKGNVTRYNSDGSLDLSFGVNGVASLDFGVTVRISDILVQNDGNIVAAGSKSSSPGSFDWDILVARFLSDGSLDPTFGTNGIAQTQIGPTFEAGGALGIQSDGKIVVAGLQITAPDLNTNSSDFLLSRFDQFGIVDQSFGVNGAVVTDFLGGQDGIQDIAIDVNDRIVAVGRATNVASSRRDFGVVRYDANGNLDTSFGVNGKVMTDFGSDFGSNIGSSDRADSVVIQSDGKILVGGDASFFSSVDMAIARYNLDGSLDTTFDGDGKLVTDINGNDFLRSLAVDTNGKILAGGFTRPGGVESGDFLLVRHNSDGSFDNKFGEGGIVHTNFFDGGDHILNIGLQDDGKIVAVGSTIKDGDSDFVLARYLSVPEPSTGLLLAVALTLISLRYPLSGE